MNESAINLSPIFYSFVVVMRHCHSHLSCSLVVLSFCHTHTHTHTHTLFNVRYIYIKLKLYNYIKKTVGENPTGKISILINLLGSFAKAWNYEGEELLRGQTNIGYTIIRPGIMKEKIDERKKKEDDPVEPRYLELMDDGGNELKVSAVEYNEIGELITELIVLENNENKLNNRRVTLAAMNVEGIPKEDGRKTLKERVLALRNDR